LRLLSKSNLLLTSLILAQPVVASEENGRKPNPYADIDWVLYQDLPDEVQQTVAPYCAGWFIDPTLTDPDIDLSLDTHSQPLVIRAEKLRQNPDGTTTAEGDVEVRQNDFRAEADKMTYNPDTKVGQLENNIRIRAYDLLMTGSSGWSDFADGGASLVDSQVVFHQSAMHGSAKQVFRDSDDLVTLTKTKVSRCNPADPDWLVTASKVTIDRDRGIAKTQNARIDLFGLPVLYLPYFSFPIDERRKSGFLAPTLGINLNEMQPSDVRLPYYWNIAPNLDNTFEPRYTEQFGTVMGDELRYLTQNSQGDVTGGYALEDDDRWWLDWNHRYQINNSTRLNVHMADATDGDYVVDFLDQSSTISYLDQSVTLTTKVEQWDVTAKVQQWAIVNPSLALTSYPYARQPSLTASRRWGTKSDQWQFRVRSELSRFTRNLTDTELASITPGDATEGTRWHNEISVGYPIERSYGFFRPTLTGYGSTYQLNHIGPEQSENESRVIYKTTLDAGLIFERPTGRFTQTLEPRLFHTFTPFQDQTHLPQFDSSTISFTQSQLYRTRRFTGGDRIGDMNRLTFGLASRWLEQDGREYLSLSADQQLRLAPEKLGLTSILDDDQTDELSLLFTRAAWRVNANLQTIVENNWHWDQERFNHQAIRMRYHPHGNALLNADLQREYESDSATAPEDTAHLSFILPFAQRWGISTAMDYNLTNDEFDETLIGIEYDACCWNLRLLSHSQETGNELLLQFELKGLGAYQEALDPLLSSRISGYRGRIYP
jgi:LPS-assembly protein